MMIIVSVVFGEKDNEFSYDLLMIQGCTTHWFPYESRLMMSSSLVNQYGGYLVLLI